MSSGDPCVEQGHTINRTDSSFVESLCATVSYRGDVTVVLTDDSSLEGYVYDADQLDDIDGARVRMLPADGSARRTIDVADIVRIEVTGRDTAEGRTFEAWMKRYVERKQQGLPANIENEDEDAEGEPSCGFC